MGAAAAVGGMMLGGALMGKKATAPAVTSQQQATQGSTQQSSSGPWIGAQPGLSTLYNAATANFNNGGPQYYPGQTLADQSWTTQHAQNIGQNLGINATNQLNGAYALDEGQNNATRTAQGAWLNADPAHDAQAVASNFDANQMAGAGTLAGFGGGAFGGRTLGDTQLAGVANGSMLNNNPWVDSMFQQAAGQVGQNYANNVMPGVASMFAGAGRYGSESMNNSMNNAQQQYGNQINQLATSIYGGNYANERGLQQGAMNQLNNAGLQERQQQLGALGQQTGNQLTGQGLKLNALGQLSAGYQNERGNMMQASALSPGLAQADWNDVSNLNAVGAQKDAYSQAQINDARARFDYAAQAPQNNLTFLNSIMSGAPQQSSSSGSTWGSSSGTGMTPGNPMAPMQGALMGGMLGSGMAGMFAPTSNAGVANVFRGY